MRDGGELLEWAEVHGNFYGTPRGPVETALSEGRDVLFDIDWQGTQQLYKTMRSDVVSVFVLPPTAEELKFRLERRAEDTPEIIERRLRNAAEEIPHWDEYDYVLVNRDVQKSLARLRGILTAERLQRVRKETIQEFVDELLSDLDSLST
jgi:guanylate kinase